MTNASHPRYRLGSDAGIGAPCPRCGTETMNYFIACDGHYFWVYRCLNHGDVVPKFSNSPQELLLNASKSHGERL